MEQKKKILILLIGVLVLLLLTCMTIELFKEPKLIGVKAECNDGYYTTSTGKGTCAGHGGIKRKFE